LNLAREGGGGLVRKPEQTNCVKEPNNPLGKRSVRTFTKAAGGREKFNQTRYWSFRTMNLGNAKVGGVMGNEKCFEPSEDGVVSFIGQ